MKQSVEYLGHKIDKKGLHPTPDNIQAIVDAPEPSNLSELTCFWTIMGSFLSKSTMVQPVVVKWSWSPECKKAFWDTKQDLIGSPALAHCETTKYL